MAVKEVHGPGPRGARGPRPKVENPGKLLKRIMDEVFRNYLPHCILVLVCIVVSALANVQASLFLQTLMDDYIVPMTRQQNPSFAPLAGALVRMGQRPHHGQRNAGHAAQFAHQAVHPHGKPAHPVF